MIQQSSTVSTDQDKTNSGKQALKKRLSGWDQFHGYVYAKKQKMDEQFAASDNGPQIFKDLSIYIDGYTKPSSDELRQLINSHGGKYQHYLAKKKVTHIIAMNLANSKISKLNGMPVVRPDWLLDSIKAGKLLKPLSYQLYAIGSSLQPQLSVTRKVVSKDDVNSEGDTTNFLREENSGLHLIKDSLTESMSSNEGTSVHEVIEDDCLFNVVKSPEKVTSVKSNHVAKAGDENFISEFYNNSRLHHLSTWKSEFCEYVNKLVNKADSTFPGREKLTQLVEDEMDSSTSVSDERFDIKEVKKVIMHLDMDCFFVSVAVRDRPELKGKPVAVTHSRGKGNQTKTAAEVEIEKKAWKNKRAEKEKAKKNGSSYKTNNTSTGWDSESDDDESENTGPNDSMGLDQDRPPNDSMGLGQDRPSNVKDVKRTDSFISLSEIASCSYEARKSDVKNGMFMGEAKKLCPEILTVPYEFEKYNEVSRKLYDIVASYTHNIEAVSCDEMLIDCSDILKATGATPLQLSSCLRSDILNATGCNASAGVSSNVLLAKLSTRAAKPNGQKYLALGEVSEFISKQSVRDLPGVGSSTSNKLRNMRVLTCGDLLRIDLVVLQREFGSKTGAVLHKYARGLDDRQINQEKERKSVSAEINYGIRFTTEKEVEKFFLELSTEVQSRLKKIHMKGKTVTLKIMHRRKDAPKETAKFMGHGVCNYLTRSSTLPLATDDTSVISKQCLTIYRATKIPASDLRGIGIQLHKLENADGSFKTKHGNQRILNFASEKTQSKLSLGVTNIADSVNKSHIQDNSLSKDSFHVKESSDASPTKDVSNGSVSHSSETPSISNDQTVTVQSSVLIDEVMRKRKAKRELPPLPTLSTMTLSNESAEPLAKTPKRHPSGGSYIVSPSQVDINVLNELPESIRMQIEEQMRRSKKVSETTSTTENTSSSQEQGCSFWNKNAESLEISGDTAFHQSIDADLQFALKLQDEENKAHKAAHSLKIRISPKKSPSKKSPGKKTSPVFKVPRSRPRGKKKVAYNPKRLTFTEVKSTKNRPSPVINITDDADDFKTSVPRDPEPVKTETCIPVPKTNDPAPVNLCGNVKFKDVKNLMREWLSSSAIPVSDDLDIIKTYLVDLIKDKDLEKAYSVINFMHGRISKMRNSEWMGAFLLIIDEVQAVVTSIHGYQFKVKF